MNIEQIAIAIYRVLQNATLKGIQPFSVFLGANGCGKTTFIDAIGFLHDCLVTNTRAALEKRGGFAEVGRRAQKLKYLSSTAVFLSTQSPFLVNNIADAKQLWIFQREDNGYTRVTRADRIPNARHFISSNAGLGDLWSEGYLTGLPYCCTSTSNHNF